MDILHWTLDKHQQTAENVSNRKRTTITLQFIIMSSNYYVFRRINSKTNSLLFPHLRFISIQYARFHWMIWNVCHVHARNGLCFVFVFHSFFLFSAIIQCAIQNQIMPLIITFIRCKSVFWHAHDFRIVQFHLFICFDHVSIFKMILSHFRISSLSNCFQIWNKLFRISFKMRCNLNEENL